MWQGSEEGVLPASGTLMKFCFSHYIGYLHIKTVYVFYGLWGGGRAKHTTGTTAETPHSYIISHATYEFCFFLVLNISGKLWCAIKLALK